LLEQGDFVTKLLVAVCTIAALCAISWAQIPGYNPPPNRQYPRLELYGGYTFANGDLFNSGDRVNLFGTTAPFRPGWNASLAFNAAKWMGFTFDASGIYGTSKIPTAVPLPFPTCPTFCPGTSGTFNVNTKLYNYLFGAQFPYRKSPNWTPFGEFMVGHSGLRGEVPGIAETSGGISYLAGVGVDRRINNRFAFRIKADYLRTGTDFPFMGQLKQNNLRVSVGIVIRSVPRKKRTLEDETQPQP